MSLSTDARVHLRSLREMLVTVVERRRRHRALARPQPSFDVASLAELEKRCRELLSRRGEASGVALARAILEGYRALPSAERMEFFVRLAERFGPDPDRLERAWATYGGSRSPDALSELIRAVEPPRQELFRRLNQAPGGTSDLVAMRADLLALSNVTLRPVDDDLVHLLSSWFNRGFLVLERISWSSGADLLERIIRYEAVHLIDGWDDLRRRLQPSDRRCYAFFHPALVDEPLIFVEVALTREIPSSIGQILAEGPEKLDGHEATMAVFYSISNCQAGLRGISFGNLLIKQVVEELKRDLPQLRTFVTLSPAPSFRRWLSRLVERPNEANLGDVDLAPLATLESARWHEQEETIGRLRPLMLKLAAHYYLETRTEAGQPVDPVARFHLGNGARLERINWPGDLSSNGLALGAGLMVNYLYDLETIEKNHEAYWNSGSVTASPAVTGLLREVSNQRGST